MEDWLVVNQLQWDSTWSAGYRPCAPEPAPDHPLCEAKPGGCSRRRDCHVSPPLSGEMLRARATLHRSPQHFRAYGSHGLCAPTDTCSCGCQRRTSLENRATQLK